MKTYYTCVTYSGSTCMGRTLQHTNNECGHKHRTEQAAQKCLTKLQNWSKDGRSCSATWYHGQVEERETTHDTQVIWRIKNYDAVMYEDAAADEYQVAAYDACTC